MENKDIQTLEQYKETLALKDQEIKNLNYELSSAMALLDKAVEGNLVGHWSSEAIRILALYQRKHKIGPFSPDYKS